MELTIGVDIGGTNTQYGIVDGEGNILAQDCFSTVNGNTTFERFISVLTSKINELLSSIPKKYEIKGLGVGAPIGNYYGGYIDNATNLPWSGELRIVEMLNQIFPFPSVLTNDANAAAIGEMIYGSAKGMKNFIVITLGTGLGSGIVTNGELLLGADSFAGEMGHTIIEENGRLCACGLTGCLECYVSATGIKRTVFELMAKYNLPNAFSHIPYDELTAKKIAEAAKNNDKIALEAFAITGKILGRKIAEAIAYFSPQAVFLFGGLALAGELLLEPTRKSADANTLKNFKNKVKILPSGIPETGAPILGAAALAWKEFVK
ncbi:MAG: ROK family protein [Bacteroidales bacterium]|nr:ROK family protein [Bacteroidales bacterium]